MICPDTKILIGFLSAFPKLPESNIMKVAYFFLISSGIGVWIAVFILLLQGCATPVQVRIQPPLVFITAPADDAQ